MRWRKINSNGRYLLTDNIYEIIGDVVRFGSEENYYILDCKKKNQHYYCYGMNFKAQSSEQKEKIIEVWLEDRKINGRKCDGEDYQPLLKEFQEPENLKRYLQFLNIQKDVLSKKIKDQTM